ncbi:unnamed protein product [Arabidopsis lyrata]|nr:unnamed protein product [Arabidopsis lyrata]
MGLSSPGRPLMEMDSSYAITRTVLVYLGSKVTIGKLALVLPYSSPLISSLGERPDYNFLLLKRETMLVYIPHLRGAVLVCLLRTNSSESRHDLLPPATISTGQDTLLDVYTPTILYSNTLPRISLLDLGTSLVIVWLHCSLLTTYFGFCTARNPSRPICDLPFQGMGVSALQAQYWKLKTARNLMHSKRQCLSWWLVVWQRLALHVFVWPYQSALKTTYHGYSSYLQFVLDGFDTLIATATIESLRIFDDVAKEALSSVLLTCDSDFGGFVSQLSEDGLD